MDGTNQVNYSKRLTEVLSGLKCPLKNLTSRSIIGVLERGFLSNTIYPSAFSCDIINSTKLEHILQLVRTWPTANVRDMIYGVCFKDRVVCILLLLF